MSSTHGFLCTVCKSMFESKESWLIHLPTESHQYLARRELWKWTLDQREQVIVIVSDKPVTVALADGLLEYFSRGDLGMIVTDFIGWPDKDHIGLVQFESRRKASQVLNGDEGRVLKLSGSNVQLRSKASDLSDVEWSNLIGTASVSSLEENQEDSKMEDRKPAISQSEVVSTEEKIKVERGGVPLKVSKEEEDDDDIMIEEPPPPVPPEVITLSEDEEMEEGEICDNNTPTPSSSTRTNPTPSSSRSNLGNSAWLPASTAIEVFSDLCKSIEIPNKEFGQLLRIVSGVRRILGDEYEVKMFRNYIMKLRNPGSDVLMIHVAKKGKNSESAEEEDIKLENHLLDTPLSRAILPGFVKDDDVMSNYREGTLFTNKSSGMRFWITSNPLRNVEVQLSRLLEYYCKFDPCVKLLFTLVYSWAQANGIHLAGKNIPVEMHHYNVPEPAALDWLIILFLTRNKVIPSVREVHERSRSRMKSTPYWDNGSDMDFFEVDLDPAFVQEWKNQNANRNHLRGNPGDQSYFKDLLVLLHRFFKMFREVWNDNRKLVLNPRDGEFFASDNFLKNKSMTKMSAAEVALLGKINENVKKEEAEEKSLPLMKNCKIYMIHPLRLTWRLSLCEENVKWQAQFVKETSIKIHDMLNQFDKTVNSDKEVLKRLSGPPQSQWGREGTGGGSSQRNVKREEHGKRRRR